MLRNKNISISNSEIFFQNCLRCFLLLFFQIKKIDVVSDKLGGCRHQHQVGLEPLRDPDYSGKNFQKNLLFHLRR